MRIRWTSLVPFLGTVATIIMSPAVINVLPTKYAAILGAIGALAQAITPAVVTDKPKQ
jgi:hypothetical protein